MNNENKIPVQASLEEQIETLKASLSYYQNEERKWKRECKEKAFLMAMKLKPETSYLGLSQPQQSKWSTKDLIKATNEIYEEFIK